LGDIPATLAGDFPVQAGEKVAPARRPE
jgi:hypothetical protein